MKHLSTMLRLRTIVWAALILCAQIAFGADLNGKWNFVLDTPGGDRNSVAEFKLDGDNVTGKWDDKVELAGTFADNKLSLSFPYESEEAGIKADLKFTGTMDGDKITGNWEFGEYSGTFVATHQ